jgi:hypothetical protein
MNDLFSFLLNVGSGILKKIMIKFGSGINIPDPRYTEFDKEKTCSQSLAVLVPVPVFK